MVRQRSQNLIAVWKLDRRSNNESSIEGLELRSLKTPRFETRNFNRGFYFEENAIVLFRSFQFWTARFSIVPTFDPTQKSGEKSIAAQLYQPIVRDGSKNIRS